MARGEILMERIRRNLNGAVTAQGPRAAKHRHVLRGTGVPLLDNKKADLGVGLLPSRNMPYFVTRPSHGQ